MLKKIKNVDINYIEYGNINGKVVVLLHGWGQNIDMMKPIGDNLSDNNHVIIIDLPGYGDSSEPNYPWTLYDYVDIINELLIDLKIKAPILIGHSFGGKISLLYASMYSVSKLILFGSPYTKEIKKDSIKLKILKTLKKIPLINKLEGFAKKHIGSTDYRNASDMMRKILVNTVNLDITNEVKKIMCPVILVWGTNDEAVPLERAYELEKLLHDAAVIEYPNCSHYAYLENLDRTISIINSFINS